MAVWSEAYYAAICLTPSYSCAGLSLLTKLSKQAEGIVVFAVGFWYRSHGSRSATFDY